MADAVIQLSVQFKDAVQNFKSLVESYQKELDKLTPGTSIYKSIEAQLKQAMALVKRTDLQANIGVSKESQITKMTSDLEGVQRILGNIKEAFSNLGFKDLNLGHGGFEQFRNDVRTIENEINSLNLKKQELENLSVAGALNKAGLDKKGFNKGDLDKGVIQYYNEVTAAIQKAEQAIVKLQEQQKLVNTSITANQGTIDQTKNAHFLNNLYNSFGMSNLKMDKVSSTYSNMLTEQYNAGTLGSVHVQNALKMIGLDDATISTLQSSGANAAQKFQEVLANLNQTKLQKSVSGYLKESYGGAQAMKNEAKAYDAANKSLTTDNARLAQIAKDLTTQTKNLNRYKGQQDKLSGVTKDYSTLQNNLNTLSQRITTLEQQLGNSVGKGLGTGNVPVGDPQASAGIAKNDAQMAMGNAIDNMARRWIGTYAIVNKVRQAIRQAWNDIKGLDKAMTNIAVVTNMSVDQLWGQIDQYMSIAQQYGVTTQGVYEVSQIFYQQGLGASDVVAATTETLKMARIAGMDYKEAADAMTVAIRAFKMEMTDAAHVTDVYSKVASITASDSNELATAMSKTASSAENVGSSFENTTAMLAVMINATFCSNSPLLQ